MAKLLHIFLAIVFAGLIQGFPQQHESSDTKPQDNIPPRRHRALRDTEEHAKEVAKNSDLPSDIEFKKEGAILQNQQNRKARDTQTQQDTNIHQQQPLDRPQISTLPQSVDFEKKDTIPQSRTVRDVEKDKNRQTDSVLKVEPIQNPLQKIEHDLQQKSTRTARGIQETPQQSKDLSPSEVQHSELTKEISKPSIDNNQSHDHHN